MGKPLKNKKKKIDDQREKQTEAIKDHGKQMVESNEVIKNDFKLTEMMYHMKSKKYLV